MYKRIQITHLAKNKGYNQIHFNRQKMLQKSTANSMYFKLDYLELLGKHWLLNRAPMLRDWRRSAGFGAALDWSGWNRLASRLRRKERRAATGVFFLSARVCLSWLREDGFRNRKRGRRGWADGRNGVTAPWLGTVDQVWFNQNEHID